MSSAKSPTFPAQALWAPNEHALFVSLFPSSQYIHTEQELTELGVPGKRGYTYKFWRCENTKFIQRTSALALGARSRRHRC